MSHVAKWQQPCRPGVKTDFLRPQRFVNPGAADKPDKTHDFRTFIHFRIDSIEGRVGFWFLERF